MYNRDIFEGMHSMIRSMVIGKDRSRRVVVEEEVGRRRYVFNRWTIRPWTATSGS